MGLRKVGHPYEEFLPKTAYILAAREEYRPSIRNVVC